MLGIKFVDQTPDLFDKPHDTNHNVTFSDAELAIGEFCAFLKDCTLTAEEVLEAYRMAIRGFYYPSKIKIYPNLSIIQAGEVIHLYQEHKKQSREYQKAKEKLKELCNPKKELPTNPIQTTQNLINSLKNAINENREFHGAFLLYDYVIQQGGLKDFRNNKQTQKNMLHQKMNDILKQEKLKKNFYLYSRPEVDFLLNTINEKKQTNTTPPKNYETQLKNKLRNQAILEIKNDLVTQWFKRKLLIINV